ncbi:MAG: hypothetical protein A2219_00305 [Elusimicrobia bacterium RIFOXYA2_FULL_50_26]|nr:MAG: hypothetical protein A2219_00305 [Elusimicrobia bacterium RIFOXYA2_FULL_50_26]OGS24744.1 MAG: hypothetical protein A2314_06020 [Elusimicrobia bacterium RIFOXYB2_FULL_50_12]
MEITEKEFAVIKEISGNHLPDQRTISHRTGISLGLTNLIIKRLITKGYIKATQLNRKKIQYMLTPKGFSEKADKSYRFALKTITHFRMLKDNIQNMVSERYKKGYDRFEVNGSGELADIVELAIRRLNNPKIIFTRRISDSRHNRNACLLVSSSKKTTPQESIDIISYLSESGLFYENN